VSAQLYWHCVRCRSNDPVEPTGDGNEYALGDHEPCECGGTAHAMTIKRAAAYEQGRALGMGERGTGSSHPRDTTLPHLRDRRRDDAEARREPEL
jgi:hypothetical protein